MRANRDGLFGQCLFHRKWAHRRPRPSFARPCYTRSSSCQSLTLVQFERFSCDAYHTSADKPASSSLGALLAPSGAFDLILIRLTPARLIDDVRSARSTSLTEPRGVRSTSWEGRMADLEVTNWFGDLVRNRAAAQ